MSSASADRVREAVSLLVAVNPKTGERFLLPTNADIAAREKETLAAFDDAMQVVQEEADAGQASGVPGKETASEDTRLDIAMQRRWFVARQKAESARLRRDRDAVRHLATRCKFTLLRPLYGQFQQIQYRVRHAHTVWELGSRGMAAGWNETLFRSLLLRAGSVEQNGQVLSADAVGELPIVIAEELGRRLAASLEIGEDELTYHSAAACSHLIKGMHPMPMEQMSYEAQVFLAWQSTGALPAGSVYELDARLALVLSELAKDTNGGGDGEASGNGVPDAPVGFPGM